MNKWSTFLLLAILAVSVLAEQEGFWDVYKSIKKLKRVITNLQEHSTLSDDGTRRTGSAGFDATINYAEQRLTSFGFNVQRRGIDYDQYAYKKSTLSVIGDSHPYLKSLRGNFPVYPIGNSGSGTVQAEAVSLPVDACDLESIAGVVNGKIVLVSVEHECGYDGTTYMSNQAMLALQAGAAGIVEEYLPAFVEDLVEDGVIGALLPALAEQSNVPVVLSNVGVGAALPSGAACGDEPLVLELTVAGSMRQVQGDSIIATLHGNCGEEECRTILLSAHADSEKNGPGINDNGSGVAATLCLARELVKEFKHYNQKVDIVVALWAGEEDNLLGSFEYIDAMAAGEVPTPTLVLNMDMIASVNGEFTLGDYSYVLADDYYDYYGGAMKDSVRGAASAINIWNELYEDKEEVFYRFESDELYGSDHFGFIISGVPSLFFHTGSLYMEHAEFRRENKQNLYALQNTRSDQCYHIGCDNDENIDYLLFGRSYTNIKTFLWHLMDNVSLLDQIAEAATPGGDLRTRSIVSSTQLTHMMNCHRFNRGNGVCLNV